MVMNDSFKIDELELIRSKDIPYSRVLSSMCTTPHPVARKAHDLFVGTNLGDPGIFIGTMELEKRLVSMLGEMLNHPTAKGYICSGGTEANIQAVRAARNITQGKNLIIPASAHFSFEKIADILGMEVRRAELDDEYRVEVSSVEGLVDENTALITGIAGTTELGQVDPLDELSKLSFEKNIPLHVDAAFGGFILPFLDDMPDFDFKLKGVTSITIDPHKMGMATIPAGGIFFREARYLNALNVDTPYLTSNKQFTLTGTRPGTGVASAYAVLKFLGFKGMREIVNKCLKNTSILVEEMEALGFEPVVQPLMNVVTFRTEKSEEIKQELYGRKWVISTIKSPKAIRFVIMPHVNGEIITEFISELKKVLKVV